ncbi:MAG: 3-methyl-2-oxobutanoate dehydrogenase subunit VorB [Actinomycetes bacterium]|jgi:2-oxoglutarate ferredoxin oxidoreductase subunit alpha|nr:3-methyl-2-oxobutanoate dehydrogenase subunit VorB [Actinomycetes bacterium]
MSEKVLMKGNEALAEAALRAGCDCFFGYPITPQTEVAAYMARRMPKVGGVYLQAESEIAAINMIYGASAAGARVLTSSSSPGISLKSEGISYLAGADLPAVIINVQRGGPGLGGIQPSQADYWQATRAMGHGDFHVTVLAPSTVQEMCDLVALAFDLADRYRTQVMILADGLLGQMMEPVVLPEPAGADARADKPWALTGTGGVRPGNVANSLCLVADNLEARNVERFRRYEVIRDSEQRAETYLVDDAETVIVAFGACARVAKSAIDTLRRDGVAVGLIRPITLWPWPADAINAVLDGGVVRRMLSVEMSMGQMIDDVKLTVNGRIPVDFFGRSGGVVPTPAEVEGAVRRLVDAGDGAPAAAGVTAGVAAHNANNGKEA